MLPIISIILLVVLDQIVKFLTLTYLAPIGTIPIINNLFSLTYVENRGAAFGIMQGSLSFLSIITTIIIIGLIIYYRKLGNTREDRFTKIALVLILAGAMGNLIDRVFRNFVVDMFQFTFINFPVFNVADMYVVFGCGLMILVALFLVKDDKGENLEDIEGNKNA